MIYQAAADATKHEPPNTVEFDGIRDGRLSSVKARGRSGPRRASSPSTPPVDPTALWMAAMIPLITSLVSKPAQTLEPPVTPRHMTNLTEPVSPIPSPSSELHACLIDFARVKDINLLLSESVLMERGLTPDIIPKVPVPHLCDITGAVEGHIWKFQSFCCDWVEHLAEKKRLTA
jgi:hypothetical protein